MSTFVHIVQVGVALGLIVFVHELGHFLAAKGFGVWVRRFAIGFGPPIVKWNRGDTEYSVRALPLGGFVDPVGEHPDAEGGDDPRALWRRPAWQRAIVFAAGVFMNALLAVALFTAASVIGVNTPSPIVGSATPLMPADKAGIKAGDRIVAINGRPVESFEDILTIISSEDAGTAFTVVVDRPGTDGQPSQRLTFEGLRSQREPGDLAPRLGLEPALEPVIYAMTPGCLDEQAGLKVGDRILAVAGRPVTRWREINATLADTPAGPVTLTILRDGQKTDLTVDPAKLTSMDLGMDPPVAVRIVDSEGPAAKAGLRRGDRIRSVNDKQWPSLKEFSETIKATPPDGKVRLVVERDGETVELESAVAVYPDRPEPRIGVVVEAALPSPLVVGAVAPDGPAARAGLKPGDRLLAVGQAGDQPRTWDDVRGIVAQARGGPIPLRVRRGQEEFSTTLTASYGPVEKFALLESRPGPILFEPLPRIYNPATAMWRGVRRTWLWLGRVYVNLIQLAKREVSTESVGGPVLIIQSSLGVATRGLGTFIDFWGILSVCVAVFNFLPVPPFDGGHVLFVLIEKIKGSPIGMKVRAWIWGAGWAAVAVLFLLVMWQDIARLL